MSRKIVLINQMAGYLFIDIVNGCAKQYDEVVLLAGSIHPLNTPLDPSVKVKWIKKYKRQTTFQRFSSWVIGFLQCLWLVKFKYRKHKLLISSNPPLATILPMFVKNDSSLVIYDIYPEAIVTSGFVSANNIAFKTWKKLNERAYKKVRSIFALTDGMVNILKPYTSSGNVFMVPAWAEDFKHNNATTENDFVRQNNLQGKFIVLYSGNLGKEYKIEALLDVAKHLKDQTNIQIIIAGKGWKKEMLEQGVANEKLDNVLLLPFQSPEMFMASMDAMHIGIVSQAVNASQVCIPSKTYNIMAFGKPIICIGEPDTDLGRVVTENNVGGIFRAGEPVAIANYIKRIAGDKELYQQLCGNVSRSAGRFTKANVDTILERI